MGWLLAVALAAAFPAQPAASERHSPDPGAPGRLGVSLPASAVSAAFDGAPGESAPPPEPSRAPAVAEKELPTPKGSEDELPATYEEFRRRAHGGLVARLGALAGVLRVPVDLARAFSAESTARGGETWEQHAMRLERRIQDFMDDIAGKGVENERFVTRFEAALRVRFRSGNLAFPLADGPESFRFRFEAIDRARSTIHLMSWAIYDDETGYETAKRLIAKAKEGVTVRVLVDGLVSRRSGHGTKILPYLERAGIPVLRWLSPDPSRPYSIQHRKALIVDSTVAIVGGMNVGNHYSHLGDSERWRDLDAYLSGAAAADADAIFHRLWNEQIERLGFENSPAELAVLRAKGFDKIFPTDPREPEGWGQRVAVINHVPSESDFGTQAMLFAIEAARASIDIENAYFIVNPALLRALERAEGRGVRIRVLTNSSESIDYKVLSYPILKSAEQARRRGVEIYLRRGSLLHSKTMVVDGALSFIGSHNLHPRSERSDGEMMFAVLDRQFASELTNGFELQLESARAADGPIRLPVSVMSRVVYWVFYNQL